MLVQRARIRRRAALACAAAGLLVSACTPGGPTDVPMATTDTSPVATRTPLTDLGLAIPTPTCSTLELTPSNAEGPFYKPGTPERVSLLEPGVSGTRLILTGYVLSTDCTPLRGAWLDFWQAGSDGEYDNEGFRLRGHQFAAPDGRYWLETVLPAAYRNRPMHMHVKVMAPGGDVLTTQLYFPEDPAARDRLFEPGLVVELSAADDGFLAIFHFILELPPEPG